MRSARVLFMWLSAASLFPNAQSQFEAGPGRLSSQLPYPSNSGETKRTGDVLGLASLTNELLGVELREALLLVRLDGAIATGPEGKPNIARAVLSRTLKDRCGRVVLASGTEIDLEYDVVPGTTFHRKAALLRISMDTSVATRLNWERDPICGRGLPDANYFVKLSPVLYSARDFQSGKPIYAQPVARRGAEEGTPYLAGRRRNNPTSAASTTGLGVCVALARAPGGDLLCGAGLMLAPG